MSRHRWGWSGRSQVERVRIYTIGSLYVIFWFLMVLTALGAVAIVKEPVDGIVMGTCALALCVAGTLAMREAIRLHPERTPLPRLQLAALGAVVLLSECLVFLLPDKARFSAVIVVVAALAWGAGGLRERSVQWCLYAMCPVLVLLPTGSLGLAMVGAALGLFLVFTVQSSLWLMSVVTQLEGSRHTQAALAVAEERLRFSRDVHDVLGRELSTIAVQAELAATLAERGDPRAPGHILQVRETAHEALREARALARGYRPLDLKGETEGAVSLLRSAGIRATASLDDLPEAWHEPVARVIREAVTNVLRHSTATHVEIEYAGGAVEIRNDGASTPSGQRTRKAVTGGTGLVGLAEQLAPSGALVTTRHEGDEFTVRADLATASMTSPRTGVDP